MASVWSRTCLFFRSVLESPVPHNSLEVHRTLLSIYRIHLINLFLSLPALLLHATILTYTLLKEERCDKPFIIWLFIVASLTAARVVPQCTIISRANALLSEWAVRPVAYETSLLMKCAAAQADRTLWIMSFIWFFIGFEWAYKSLTCHALSPVLYQYVTVLILFFLAMIGMNCVLCMGSSTMLLLACLVPSERFVQLFEEYRRGAYALPAHALKRMKSFQWTHEMDEQNVSKMCPICLGDYEEGQSLRELPCEHKFHQTCIDQWFKGNSTCPLRCHVNLMTGARMDSGDTEMSGALLIEGEYTTGIGSFSSANYSSELESPADTADENELLKEINTASDFENSAAAPMPSILTAPAIVLRNHNRNTRLMSDQNECEMVSPVNQSNLAGSTGRRYSREVASYGSYLPAAESSLPTAHAGDLTVSCQGIEVTGGATSSSSSVGNTIEND